MFVALSLPNGQRNVNAKPDRIKRYKGISKSDSDIHFKSIRSLRSRYEFVDQATEILNKHNEIFAIPSISFQDSPPWTEWDLDRITGAAETRALSVGSDTPSEVDPRLPIE